MMDAVKFIKEMKRMCKSYENCGECPGGDKDCIFYLNTDIELVPIVEKWSAEHGCIPFGNDANIATQKCADDGFRNYITKSELAKCEIKSKIDDLQRILTEYIANPTSRSPLQLSSTDATLCCLGLELLKKE